MMHQTLEILAGSYPRPQSPLGRLDARLKLIIALALIVAVVLSVEIVFPLAVLALCVGAWLTLHMPWRMLVVRLGGPLALAAVLCLLRAFSFGAVAAAGHSHQAVLDGLLLGARVLGSVSVLVLLGTIAPAHEIFAAMKWAHVPAGFLEIAVLMYRYIFELFHRAHESMSSQQVRLGYVGLKRGLASAGNLVGIVMLRSLEQAQRTHEAMTVRGYEHSLPMGRMRPLRRGEWVALATALAVIAAGFCLAGRSPL